MNLASLGRQSNTPSANHRLKWWYGALLFIIAIFVARLFYLQIIRHEHYRQAALTGQLKQYSINAERGVIEAYEGTKTVPIVLNQKLYTLYADPVFIKDAAGTAAKLTSVIGGDASQYAQAMKTPKTRYVVLAKRLSADQQKKIASLKLAGVGTQAVDYRIYPQGTLAAQLLGFVNNDGQGTYGIEQALDKQLAGTPGMLKAITDVRGVPLVASRDNIEVDPRPGDKVILTIDVAMQNQLEKILKQGLDKTRSPSGSALIIDPQTGAIKAMANFPTYDPAQYYNVSDASVFNNAAVSSPLEVGSAMKALTASAALDQGVVKPDTTYSDPGRWPLDGHVITNIEEVSSGTHSVADILNLSINTGATWMLMQMGGGQINPQARQRWHDYMVNHFQLGKKTGIEQGYEASGFVPDPAKGYALNLTYANTAFGQAMTATPLQMAAALASVLNGGTYYQPHLVDRLLKSNGQFQIKKPTAVKQHVVSPKVGRDMQGLLEYVVRDHYRTGFSYLNFGDNYSVGGKTGTAQIASPTGGYLADKYNGTYIGFVGGDKAQYVIAVRVNTPGIGGYAGSQAAQPIFASLAHMLINDFNVLPKSH
jgi:cell division protein FtsI/penicillin-binding protein 2